MSETKEKSPDLTSIDNTCVAGTSTSVTEHKHQRSGSVLEAVPEEMVGNVPGTVPSEVPTNTEHAEQCSAANVPMSAAAGGTTTPHFHIPESNASDVAPSECSSHYRHGTYFKNGAFFSNAFFKKKNGKNFCL